MIHRAVSATRPSARMVILMAGVSMLGVTGGQAALAQGLQAQPAPTASPNPGSGQSPPLTPPNLGAASPGASVLPSGAASQAATGVAEIVVTAQRRSENLQNVPVAVTALSGSALSSAGVQGTADLNTVVPALNFTTAIGALGLPSIRGVGASSAGPGLENPVATYIDGVYIVSAVGSLLGLHDISQVAVLKGPQGTLFGRNATGGLIQITTLDPTTQPRLDVDASLGDRAYSAEDLYVSGGLIDKLTGSFTVSNDDLLQGFGHNLYNGDKIQTHRATSMRGKLVWKPDTRTQISLSADYSKYKASDPALRVFGGSIVGPLPGGPRDVDSNVQPATHVEQWGTSLNVRHDFDGFQLVSISAYRETDSNVLFDADATPVPAIGEDLDERDDQTSEELQILSTTKGPFSWVAGAYYLHARGAFDPATSEIIGVPGPVLTENDEDLDSYSVFGQGTYKLRPDTDLTAGIRYTLDHRSIVAIEQLQAFGASIPAAAPIDATKDFSAPTARVSLDHRFSPELLAYVSYNRGFKSGTFAPQSFPLVTIQPETLNAYEVGAKTDLFDRRVRFNAAGFYYDYSNKQTQFISNGEQLLYDAKKAQMYGFDGDLTVRLTDNFQITAGASAIHAEYTDFTDGPVTIPTLGGGNALVNGDDSGDLIEDTPRYTINIGPSYRLPTPVGALTFNLNYYHNSGYYASPDDRVRQSPYDIVNADILFVPNLNEHLSVDVWGKNLTDAVYASQIAETQFGDQRLLAPGETYGFTVGLHY